MHSRLVENPRLLVESLREASRRVGDRDCDNRNLSDLPCYRTGYPVIAPRASPGATITTAYVPALL